MVVGGEEGSFEFTPKATPPLPPHFREISPEASEVLKLEGKREIRK